MRSRFLWSAVAAGLLLAGCGDNTDAPAEAGRHGSLALAPCATGEGAMRVEAMCGSLAVPEDRDAPDGRRIELNIAVLPARNDAGLEPVFFLAGGPGQAATTLAGHIDAALREVRRSRDVVLVDQRGTGGSNPLDCVDADGKPMPLEAAGAEDADAIARYATACLQGLAGRADPRFYTTSDAVADLEAVRTALGVDTINLVGGSYGTRVAQQYAMRHPDRVRTVVLDGVAPNDLVVGAEFARTFEDALALQAAQCAGDATCTKRFPVDAPTRLREVIAQLRAQPVEVEYRDATSGAVARDTATADTVTTLAFLFSYAPETASLLPLMLDEAAQGRYGALLALTRMAGQQVAGGMNRGMQWSVLCAEDAPRWNREASDADGTILGGEVARMFFAACPVWPHGRAEPAQFEPLRADLPVLLLSGELDPVTPPAYGERVAAGLANGRHVVLRGQGHGTLALGCMPKLVARFIETADAAALDTACLDTLREVPPFTSFNGWDP
ncbi:alpha/beta hydrolase [Luteimonas yindakuii]|uniref:alpha/beta hydrolase n=1 Tax=Luteimonas yindakuii TaxID=2565782 RepID=UPI001107A478|nr:alpha/beta hydrolase [Luteimonas yindakuii]QCO66632.2 alpha/beta hydrolase [Luteimonas yindakuii]